MEGRALRDRADRFEELGCTIVGASFDTPEENRTFAEEQGFDFPLLSDVDRSVGRSYAVARDDDDQYAAFPRRLSYLIDGEGTIRRMYVVADVKAHADEVLADLAELQA